MQLASLGGLSRPFVWLCTAQTLTQSGTALTGFAIGVWIFQTSGKVLDFALLELVTTLPLLLVLPWAGSVADRVDRRRVVLVADAAAALATATLCLLLWTDALAVRHVYAIAFVWAVAGAFQAPAFRALAASLLRPEQATQGSGLLTLGGDVVSLLAPLSAGALMAQIGLPGIALLDLVLCCVGVAMVLRVFALMAGQSISAAVRPSGWIGTAAHDFRETLAYFQRNPLLRSLMGYAVLQGALVSLVTMLITPLVLSRYSSTQLGWVLTLGGVGSVLGSSLLVITGQRDRLMQSLLVSDAVISLCVLLVGLHASLAVYITCAFVAFSAAAAAIGYSGALWMRKVPSERRGRVYAFVGTVATLVGPLVAAVGGLAADQWLEPALAGESPFQRWAASLVDPGPGRALALVFVVAGSLGLLLALLGLSRRRFRALDRLVPDV